MQFGLQKNNFAPLTALAFKKLYSANSSSYQARLFILSCRRLFMQQLQCRMPFFKPGIFKRVRGIYTLNKSLSINLVFP